MESSKIMMAHVATEIIVIGGISFFFHKKISQLNQKIQELEKKIDEKHESTSSCQHDPQKFEEFRQQTTGHINNIYSLLQKLTETNKNSHYNIPPPPPPPHQQSSSKEHREHFRGDSSNLRSRRSRIQFTPISEVTSQLEVINEDEHELKESHHKQEYDEKLDDEKLDEELDEELDDLEKESTDQKRDKSLIVSSPVDTDIGIIDIKNDDNNTITESPLEFIPTKGKKLVKKRK
jgi:hypothetical protein